MPSKPTLGSYCWTQTAVNTAGTGLQLTDGCNGYETKNTWRPVASVGAGMSGAATQQLVNYQEFGRCLDATDQDPDHSFMIAFPCKQSPNPSEIRWNQKYTLQRHDTGTSRRWTRQRQHVLPDQPDGGSSRADEYRAARS